VAAITREMANGDDDELARMSDPNALSAQDVPAGVEVYEINGPFFFGVADRLHDTLRGLEKPPKVFILRMRRVPAIDATGLHALREFHKKCNNQGTQLVLSGVHAQPLQAFINIGFDKEVGMQHLFGNVYNALNHARRILGLSEAPIPTEASPEVAREGRPQN
jgi:SulP family sulfate permease